MSDSEDESPDKQLKIVVMGDGASGKVHGPLYSCQLGEHQTLRPLSTQDLPPH